MRNRLVRLALIGACALWVAYLQHAATAPAKTVASLWELSGGVSESYTLTEDDVEYLKTMGETSITLSEDGTAVLLMFGSRSEGTWRTKDENVTTLLIDGKATDLVLMDDDRLTMNVDATHTMEFTRQ